MPVAAQAAAPGEAARAAQGVCMRAYFVLHHESVVANLLECVLFHDYAAQALGDASDAARLRLRELELPELLDALAGGSLPPQLLADLADVARAGGLGGLLALLCAIAVLQRRKMPWGHIVAENLVLIFMLGLYELAFFKTIGLK
jgi:hypothetical protein